MQILIFRISVIALNILKALFVSFIFATAAFPAIETKQESEEISQQKLLDMIRRGVVAIRVTAHVIIDKSSNDKMWCGTGFIVDIGEKCLIVTNAHVAGELAVCTYEVKFGNGQRAEARLEYIDSCYDFAVLSVNKSEVPAYCCTLKLADKLPELNMPVYAMGNSSNNEFSTYNGHIFDTECNLWLKNVAEQSFQFSGLTVPGASGSPVFNATGEVIGVLYGGKWVSGAALPILYVLPVIEAVKNKQKFSRYMTGCVFHYMPVQDATDGGLIPESVIKEHETLFPNSKLLAVSRKISAFGGAQNPLRAGDIILDVNDVLIGSCLYKIDQLIQKKAGKSVKFTVYRDGQKMSFDIPTFKISTKKMFKMLSFAGATFFELTDDIKIATGQKEDGVFLADSEAGSPFMAITSPFDRRYSGGFFKILTINGEKITSLDDLSKAIQSLSKETFKVTFLKLGGDTQELCVVAKYQPNFAEASLFVFNDTKNIWEMKLVKSPS
ncbi:hypothetical protein FACS1894113_1080 [Alphaproteobacteria bacterium]|nr:hypothetical protein FACS1894113_1080 [Alphaproteobacteria bacterium]